MININENRCTFKKRQTIGTCEPVVRTAKVAEIVLIGHEQMISRNITESFIKTWMGKYLDRKIQFESILMMQITSYKNLAFLGSSTVILTTKKDEWLTQKNCLVNLDDKLVEIFTRCWNVEGVELNTIKAIENWPKPKNKQQVRHFLSFSYYSIFLESGNSDFRMELKRNGKILLDISNQSNTITCFSMRRSSVTNGQNIRKF